MVLWTFLKVFLWVFGFQIFIFALMIFFVMTDERIGFIGKSLGLIVKYVLGFPLVLINQEYPFFLDRGNPPNYFILLVFLNLLIQTGAVVLVQKAFQF